MFIVSIVECFIRFASTLPRNGARRSPFLLQLNDYLHETVLNFFFFYYQIYITLTPINLDSRRWADRCAGDVSMKPLEGLSTIIYSIAYILVDETCYKNNNILHRSYDFSFIILTSKFNLSMNYLFMTRANRIFRFPIVSDVKRD